ncbi:MAG TPA: LytTR family transcriptional regulator [Clostridiales bacterium]|nr:LytTR family transcriptional regulator [Clostridiales bacterium]
MRVRIEQADDLDHEEVIIRCKRMTPEIEAITRQLQQIDKPKAFPAFFKGDGQYYLSLMEIMFFETDAERVFAHTASDSFETKMRLYELESMLPGYFVRVSRSAIVNTLHVMSIQRGLTHVNLISFRKSHKAIYCSRMYSSQLIKKMEERILYENK